MAPQQDFPLRPLSSDLPMLVREGVPPAVAATQPSRTGVGRNLLSLVGPILGAIGFAVDPEAFMAGRALSLEAENRRLAEEERRRQQELAERELGLRTRQVAVSEKQVEIQQQQVDLAQKRFVHEVQALQAQTNLLAMQAAALEADIANKTIIGKLDILKRAQEVGKVTHVGQLDDLLAMQAEGKLPKTSLIVPTGIEEVNGKRTEMGLVVEIRPTDTASSLLGITERIPVKIGNATVMINPDTPATMALNILVASAQLDFQRLVQEAKAEAQAQKSAPAPLTFNQALTRAHQIAQIIINNDQNLAPSQRTFQSPKQIEQYVLNLASRMMALAQTIQGASQIEQAALNEAANIITQGPAAGKTREQVHKEVLDKLREFAQAGVILSDQQSKALEELLNQVYPPTPQRPASVKPAAPSAPLTPSQTPKPSGGGTRPPAKRGRDT